MTSQHLQLWATAWNSLLVPVSYGFSNLDVLNWVYLQGNGTMEVCI